MTDVMPRKPDPEAPAGGQPTLVTPRLRLRPLRAADAAQIALHAGDRKVAWMTTRIPHPYPPGMAEAVVERAITGRLEENETLWALDSGGDGENGLIGMIALRRRADGAGEIGYWVAPAVWGAGYAGEAVEAIKAHGAAIGLPALAASVFQDNLASVKVLVRAGFVYEGESEIYSLARGGMVPAFRYRLALGGGA